VGYKAKWVACLSLLLMVAAIATPAEARIFGRRSRGGSSYGSVPAGCSNATAQGVAEACAKIGGLRHMGGHGGMFEGLGMSSSKQGAYNNCCYARSGMRTVDVGYARTRGGQWICCRRYKP
jgi:hypothetical protein